MLRAVDARKQRQARHELVARRAADREAAGRNTKRLSRFRMLRRRIGTVLVASLAPLILRVLAWTWRIERTGNAGLARFRSDLPWITVLWHGRMLAMMPIKPHYGRNIGVLVSPSDDGGLAKTALKKFGCQVVRGSLSRRGASAMREMLALLRREQQLVLTPDGPRGPRHSINTGAAWLARATGTPIIALSVGVSRAWYLRSWDRMCIPKPFARLVVHYGDPLHIDEQSDDAALETHSNELRERLIAGEQAAFAQLKVACDFATPPEEATSNDHDPNTSEEGSGSHRAD
jgi:hypothetical protein